jgi:hypothetical protein
MQFSNLRKIIINEPLWYLHSVVGTETAYGLDDEGVGVRVPVGSRIFSSSRPDRLWGPPNLQWVPGALFLGIKRPGREADHSPPASS